MKVPRDKVLITRIIQSNVIMCRSSLTDAYDTFENQGSTLERMTETVSIRDDTHINEEASFLYAPYLLSLTCIVACSVCFRTNQSNRAQYKQRNIGYKFEITPTIPIRSSIIKQIIRCPLFSHQNNVHSLDAAICHDDVYVCIYLYRIIALIASNSKSISSFLCHLIRYLLDNVVYAPSATSCARSIIS